MREGEGVAAQVLVKLGADLGRVRQQVTQLLAGRREGTGAEPAAAGRRRTPAAEEIVAAAEQLAGGSPMGSHHLLEALVRTEDSAAARVFAALGMEPDTLAAKIDEVGIEGTNDLTDDEAAARQMEIRLEDDEVRIVLRDQTTVELARSVTERLGGPIRGDDPLAGGLVGLHQSAARFLAELLTRLAPSSDEARASDRPGGISARIERAIHSRLRRRSR